MFIKFFWKQTSAFVIVLPSRNSPNLTLNQRFSHRSQTKIIWFVIHPLEKSMFSVTHHSSTYSIFSCLASLLMSWWSFILLLFSFHYILLYIVLINAKHYNFLIHVLTNHYTSKMVTSNYFRAKVCLWRQMLSCLSICGSVYASYPNVLEPLQHLEFQGVIFIKLFFEY